MPNTRPMHPARKKWDDIATQRLGKHQRVAMEHLAMYSRTGPDYRYRAEQNPIPTLSNAEYRRVLDSLVDKHFARRVTTRPHGKPVHIYNISAAGIDRLRRD